MLCCALRLEGRVGTVAPGMLADVIVVDQDPLQAPHRV
jgi:imidazolonepropionase-like amidohydrolase